MPAPSLFQIARKACIRNIKEITDVGDAPYAQVRTVLIKVENPEQLRQIELASPQICGEDGEIWKEFIKRDIPQWWTIPHEPKNPKNWYKVYRKLKEDNEAKVKKDAQALKAAFQGLQEQKDNLTSKLVHVSELPDLRKNTRIGRKPSKTQGRGGAATLTFTGGSRTKLTSGQSILEKARREATEIKRKHILATPTHLLNDRATKVRTAAKGLVDAPKTPLSSSNTTPKIDPKKITPPKLISSSNTGPSPKGTNMNSAEKERKPIPKTVPSVAGSKRDSSGTTISKSDTKVTSSPPKAVASVAGSKRDSIGTPISKSDTKATSSPNKISTSSTESKVTGSETPSKAAVVAAKDEPEIKPARPYKVPRLGMSPDPDHPAPMRKVIIKKAKPVDIFMRRPNNKR